MENLASQSQIVAMLQELGKIFVYIVVPGLAGITFFALAKFVRHITPLRALTSSSETYYTAFWGFLIFGIYLALRPVQVLAGPHPWPLIISTFREFLLQACFAPITFCSMMILCLGPDRFSKRWILPVFVFCAGTAGAFCVLNAKAVGGSEEIVKLGMMTAYDGLWYKSNQEHIDLWMKLMTGIRLANPALLLFAAGVVVLFHAKNYPSFKRKQYNNMPKKLVILASAVMVYSATLALGTLIDGYKQVPDQWGLYHVGSLVAGILESISLSMPVRSEVQVSEHEDFLSV